MIITENFRFISQTEDVSKILQQVLDNPQDWGSAGGWKNAAGKLQNYGCLPLIMGLVKSQDDLVKHSRLQRSTPLFNKYTEIQKWLRSKGIKQTARCAFFKLPPDGGIGLHVDEGDYYLHNDRYHLSLQGNYLYTCGGEEHMITPGTFFWFNNKKPHMAQVVGDVDRITFVFDVPKSRNNP